MDSFSPPMLHHFLLPVTQCLLPTRIDAHYIQATQKPDCESPHRESVAITYNFQAFDSSQTPVAAEQIPVGPVLVFKAPTGTVFQADVLISISFSKFVMELLPEIQVRRGDVGAVRMLLAHQDTKALKPYWFNTAIMVNCLFPALVFFLLRLI